MLWTFLEGLIPRNPIRLSSFPPTAILVLLAQTGSRYYFELRRSFSSAIPSPGSAPFNKAASHLFFWNSVISDGAKNIVAFGQMALFPYLPKARRTSEDSTVARSGYHWRLPTEGFLMGHRRSFCVLHLQTLTHAAGAGSRPPDLPFSAQPGPSGPQRARSRCHFPMKRTEFCCSGLVYSHGMGHKIRFRASGIRLILKIKSKWLKR